MDTSLQEQIFQAFKSAASVGGIYPRTRNADSKYQKLFDRWFAVVSNHRTVLNDQNFSTAWIFPRLLHPTSKHPNLRRHASTLIVALNDKTGRIAIIERNGHAAPLDNPDFFVPKNISQFLQETKPKNADDVSLWAGNRPYYAHIRTFLKNMDVKLALSAAGRIESVHADSGAPKRDRTSLTTLAGDIARSVMTREEEIALTEIENSINRRHLDFAEELFRRHHTNFLKRYPPLSIYNFLVDAPSPEAAEYRKGALTVLAPMAEFFEKETSFWSKIDSGMPIFSALATELQCSPSTVKHILKQAPTFFSITSFRTWAENLNDIDVAQWPTSFEDAQFFYHLTSVAKHRADVFYQDRADTYKNWLRERKTRSETTWREVFRHELRHQIGAMLAEGKSQTLVEKRLNGELPTHSLKDIDSRFQSFCANAVEKFRSTIYNISHMKQDVTLRLIRPAILLAMEHQGISTPSRSIIEGIEKRIEREMWGKTSPSDQISASSYWHSPRVNFGGRFQSLAVSPDEQCSWISLFPAPLTLKSGIVLHPLQSRADLKEEADAMEHCVWSYTYRCMANSHHIFSVRSPEGNRLTTLTVQDYFDAEKNLRQIKLVEHKGHHNKTPDPKAVAAEKDLLDSVNNGDLTPDWASIDSCKAGFIGQLMNNSVGYDFYNPHLRDEVASLYPPCLPRHLSKHTYSFDALSKALNIEKIVADFFAPESSSPLENFIPLALPEQRLGL